MNTKLTIQDQMRAQYVKRWTTVHMNHEQSMAEHSFNVALLAAEIATRMGKSPEFKNLCLRGAVYHDIEEVITGDIPTPTKKRLGRDDILNPNQIQDSDVADVVKAADMLEGAYQIWQHGCGVHAEKVKAEVVAKFQKFIDHHHRRKNYELAYVVALIWKDLQQGERTG